MINFFKKVKSKANDLFESLIVRLILRFKSPKLAAFLIAFSIKKINHSGKYKILCLRRSIFMDDVAAMVKFSGRLQYLSLSRNIIQEIFWFFVVGKSKRDLYYQDYYLNNNYQAGVEKYYNFLRKLIPELKKRVGFDAVFSGNFVYVEQQEFARVCKELYIPFIVLHKESLTVGVYKDSAELHRGCKFIGDKMMVYNDKVRKQLTEVDDLGSIPQDAFVVVGSPRTDYLFLEKAVIEPKKQIVFFSSMPVMRFARIFKDTAFLDKIEKRSEDFHKWAIQFAKDYPDIKVIIKTKVAQYYLDYPKKIFEKNYSSPIPNLEITSGGRASDLIKESMVVCAFNSMTQIEAIIIDQPVISAFYGDLVTDQPWDYFGEYPGLVKYVRSYQDFKNAVLDYQNLKNRDAKTKDEFLKRFIGFTDGQSSKRAETEIIGVIEKRA